jgi:protein required for attachment to host cells
MKSSGTTWVLVADEGIARFFLQPDSGSDLEEVDTLTDAAAHAQNADLRRDAHGRRGGAIAGRHGSSVTASAGDEALHLEAEQFARRVAARLGDDKRAGRFDALRIVAAPRFLGLLRKALSADVASVVTGEMNKDLIHLDPRALTRQVFAEAGAS